jgi:hypothetical protein
MRNKIARILVSARTWTYAAAATFFILSDRAAQAVSTGLDEAAEEAYLKPKGADAQTDLPTIIGSIVSQALGLVGVIFLILMIYGGFLWMTAQGNEEQIKKAKNIITGAVIGAVIVFMAYAITFFITETLATRTLKTP